ncbi:competence protein ComFB [Gammaproteobacteria bacterium]
MFSSVHNYYEHMVFERILLIMKERREYINTDFMEDIACIALNHLPSRYVRHNVDTAFNLSDAEQEKMNNQVLRAVNEAFEFSKRRHAPH